MQEKQNSNDRSGSSCVMLPIGGGSSVPVPKHVDTCPECGGIIHAFVVEWEEDTKKPVIGGGIQLTCENEEWDGEGWNHRWWQSDWQSVVDNVDKWAGSVER